MGGGGGGGVGGGVVGVVGGDIVLVRAVKGEVVLYKFPRIIKFERQQDFFKLIVEET